MLHCFAQSSTALRHLHCTIPSPGLNRISLHEMCSPCARMRSGRLRRCHNCCISAKTHLMKLKSFTRFLTFWLIVMCPLCLLPCLPDLF